MRTGLPSVDKPWLKFYPEITSGIDANENIVAFLMKSQNNQNDFVALEYFGTKITYSDLIKKIENIAGGMVELGVEKGDVVSIQSLTMPETVILFYAIAYIGAIANFIYISSDEENTKANLKETKSKLLFVVDGIFNDVNRLINGTEVKCAISFGIEESADLVTKFFIKGKKKRQKKKGLSWKNYVSRNYCKPDINGSSDDAVAMVYTSGTTGKSKAVVLSHKNLNSLVVQYRKTGMVFTRGEKFMNAIPMFVAYGLVFGVHVPLCLGLTDILVVNPNPNNLGKEFAKYCPNYLIQGYAGVENIISNKKVQKMDLSFIRVIGVGGDAIPDSFVIKVNDFLKAHNSTLQLVIGYGMTEVAATVVTSTPLVNKIGSVGIPLPDTVVKIVEPETEKELDYDCIGEICFHAPTMMKEYYNQPDETNGIIRKHEDNLLWIHSGDLGRIDVDGFVYMEGRIKRLIGKWHEGVYHKIVPKIIENVIAEEKEIIETSVVKKTLDASHNELVAFVVCKVGADENTVEEQLKAKMQRMFEPWEQIDEYRFVGALPRNITGKVDYRMLEEACTQKESE